MSFVVLMSDDDEVKTAVTASEQNEKVINTEVYLNIIFWYK